MSLLPFSITYPLSAKSPKSNFQDERTSRHPKLRRLHAQRCILAKMGLNPNGRNWGPLVNWDSLGKFLAAFTIIWTFILGVGMGWLIVHRHLPYLRIRNIPLACAATTTLHVYLVKILLAYIVNGHFSCTAEFWIMSIYLPFGIALFQASMVQLLSISGQQQKLLDRQQNPLQQEILRRQPGLRGIWSRWRAMTEMKRAELLIATGMVSQFIVTLIIYLASRKFHASWGIMSHGHEFAPICRKGLEWIPSTLWQLVWAWFYGPYNLYRIRNIRDVHFWRLQTIICVVSGLPGTPLWIAAVYSTSFETVNKWYIPPMWLAPGIITMQFCTIFFPIREAYISRSHLRDIEAWETKKAHLSSTTDYSSSTQTDSMLSPKRPNFAMHHQSSGANTTISVRRREMYTMAALEKALTMNPMPLLQFAATRDFTGENIVFLLQVRDWRASWAQWRRDGNGVVMGKARHHLFNLAAAVFAFSIDSKTAEFPINIDHKMRARLEAVFGSSVAEMKKARPLTHNPHEDVAPFLNHIELNPTNIKHMDPPDARASYRYSESVTDRDQTPADSQHHAPSTAHSQELILPPSPSSPPPSLPCIPHPKAIGMDGVGAFAEGMDPYATPAGFDEEVFDEAEKAVKYMVLTNTWPKFIGAKRDSATSAFTMYVSAV